MKRSLPLFLLTASLATAAQAAVPLYIPKPPTWTSMLITHDEEGVTDVELAGWIKSAQTLASEQETPRSFSLIATLTQCFGGGFLTEMVNAPVASFGADSASRYWQPSSYDEMNNRSHYAWAWKSMADDPAKPNDLQITDTAWNATVGGLGAIPVNPRAHLEQAQYRDNDNNPATPPPMALDAEAHRYAILWVGQHDPMDQNDLTHIYDVLRNRYNYAAANILILYDDGTDPDVNDGWQPDQAADATNLEQAFTCWLQAKLFNQPQADRNAMVYFWAGGHGGASSPVTMSVDAQSVGQPGTDVFVNRVFGFAVEEALFTGGSGANIFQWENPNGGDLDAVAFGVDFQPVLFEYPRDAVIYFSVDRDSKGLPNSGVAREVARMRSPAPDVFVRTDESNRQAIDGDRSLGLEETGEQEDELNALSMRDVSHVLDPMGKPLRPIFYSLVGSSQIRVWDPRLNRSYIYYDFTWDFEVAPKELDALALIDDDFRDPMKMMELRFNPNVDRMLFSIGRNDVWVFDACDVIKYGAGAAMPALWRSCQQLGLDQLEDNLDALDLGAGPDGKPDVPFPPYDPTPIEPPPPPPPPVKY